MIGFSLLFDTTQSIGFSLLFDWFLVIGLSLLVVDGRFSAWHRRRPTMCSNIYALRLHSLDLSRVFFRPRADRAFSDAPLLFL